MTAISKHPALIDSKSVQVMYRPVVVEGVKELPNPTKLSFEECKDWWSEQYRRCTEGWIAPDGVYINPIYYFYLNFVKVFIIDELNKGKKSWESPYVRDGDKEYFDAVWNNRSYEKNGVYFNAKDVIVAKGRRKGWTTCELYGITMWFFLFRQDISIARAYPSDKILSKERKLFTKAYSYIHNFFKGSDSDEPIDILENNEERVSQYTYTLNKDGVKIKKDLINSVNFFTVTATGGGVRGDALGLIVVVEAGVHTKLLPLKTAADETLKVGDWKFGMMLIGGTSDAINNTNTDYKDLFFNHEDYGMVKIFTPSWKCYFGQFDYFTGKSKRIEALKRILEERERFKQSNNYKAYRSKLQENPISPEEAFIPQGESEYDQVAIDDHIILLLRAQMNKTWLRGRLEYETDINKKRTGNVIFVEDKSGLWLVQEEYGMPITDVKDLYLAAIDDVYKDKAPHSSSKNAMIIYMKKSIHVKGESGLPVAFYLGRHQSRIRDYHEFKKGTIMWNPKVMYEHNETAGYIGFARENGLSHHFIYHNGQIGVRLSDDVKADLTVLGLKYFDDLEYQKILHTDLIESFKYWNSGINSDLCSAMHLLFLAIEKTKKIGTKSEKIDINSENKTADIFNFYGANAQEQNVFGANSSSDLFNFNMA